jgi:hypothetical protein
MNDYLPLDAEHRIGQHLKECDVCQNIYIFLKKQLNQMKVENERECDMYRRQLLQHDAGENSNLAELNHIEECESCRALHDIITGVPEFDDIVNLNVIVPQNLTHSIESLLSQKRAEHFENPKNGLIEFLKDKKADLFEKVVLFLTPAPHPAFLGTRRSTGEQVNFNGKTVVLATGRANADVRIYSMKNIELENKKTNQEGIVVLENFLPGKYKIYVEGFNIEKLNYI